MGGDQAQRSGKQDKRRRRGEGEGTEIEAKRHRVASPLVNVVIHDALGQDEGVGAASEGTQQFIGDRQKVQTWNRKEDAEREEERLERKRGETEKRVKARQTWVEDADDGRRNQTREKEEVHDATGFFGVGFGAVTAQPRAEDEGSDEECNDADESIVDGIHG